MTLKDTCDKIMKKANEAGQQEGELSRKLEAYKHEKEQAEANKAAALEAKDEQAYKAACRAIADADAGIEFSTICLRECRREKYATAADDQEIKNGLRNGLNEVYGEALKEIEKALNTIKNTAQQACDKMNVINSMAQTWGESVMREIVTNGNYCGDKKIHIEQYINMAKGRLTTLQMQQKGM